jgi:hypothetical protein
MKKNNVANFIPFAGYTGFPILASSVINLQDGLNLLPTLNNTTNFLNF